MTCDWCDELKPVTVVEQEPETLALCDDCKDEWGRAEYYGSRTEP